jgi:hypothetical protein
MMPTYASRLLHVVYCLCLLPTAYCLMSTVNLLLPLGSFLLPAIYYLLQ